MKPSPDGVTSTFEPNPILSGANAAPALHLVDKPRIRSDAGCLTILVMRFGRPARYTQSELRSWKATYSPIEPCASDQSQTGRPDSHIMRPFVTRGATVRGSIEHATVRKSTAAAWCDMSHSRGTESKKIDTLDAVKSVPLQFTRRNRSTSFCRCDIGDSS